MSVLLETVTATFDCLSMGTPLTGEVRETLPMRGSHHADDVE